MSSRITTRHALLATTAGAAVAASTLGVAALAPPAVAGGGSSGHHSHHGGDGGLVLELTARTSDRLLAGDGSVRTRGDAWSRTDDGRVTVVLGVDDDGHRRGGDGHDDGVLELSGSVVYDGAGPDVVWSALEVEDGRLTGKVGGERVALLRVPDRGGHHRGDERDAQVRLTAAGAASLNRAVGGSPFEKGDAYADGGC